MSQFDENYFEGAPRMYLIGPMFLKDDIQLVDKNTTNIIFVDGGAHQRAHFQYDRSLSIGDGDSYQGELDILVSPMKDQSDLALALKYIPASCTKVTLYGFLKGRSDHELAVLGEIYSFITNNPNIQSADCYHKQKKWSFYNSGHHQQNISGRFSLLTLKEQVITIDGDIDYPAHQKVFQALSSLGLSNQQNKPNGIIKITCEAPILIIQDHHE